MARPRDFAMLRLGNAYSLFRVRGLFLRREYLKGRPKHSDQPGDHQDRSND